jgi:lipoate-protein ligase A
VTVLKPVMGLIREQTGNELNQMYKNVLFRDPLSAPRDPASSISRLGRTSAAEEQSWNAHVISTEILVPRISVWNHSSLAVVLGSGQEVDEHVRQKAMSLGIAVLKRATGGGIVLVGPHMLSVSVALPPEHQLALIGPRAAYQHLGSIFSKVLKSFDVACEPSPVAKTFITPSPSLCFGSISIGEVVSLPAGRKLVGFAQRRRPAGTLIVGGLLLTQPDWSVLDYLFELSASLSSILRRFASCCMIERVNGLAVMPVAECLQQALCDEVGIKPEKIAA